MNEGEKRILLAAAMGWVLPAALLMVWPTRGRPVSGQIPETTVLVQAAAPEKTRKISVLREDGTAEEMELEDYLVGVVAAEMPASFEMEALKAQAVVARTYTLRRCFVSRKHEDYDVCRNAACCQGYVSPDRLGQTEAARISAAVASTAGQVLTYDGDLVEATYFSSSGGSTEDAAAVWGSDVPYLQATDSPGEANIFPDTVYFSREELEDALDVTLYGDPEDWTDEITYTEGDGVDTWVLSGESFRGTEVRRLLGLNSTCFRVEPMGDGLSISTVGFGHRVGMSQYGADAMAVSGDTYRDILAHYYRGTQVTDMGKIDIFF